MNVLKTNNRFSSLLEDNKPAHTRHVHESRYINKYKSDTKHDTKNIKINNTNINMNDFPALTDPRINDNVCDVKPNYVAKVLHQNIIEPETAELLPYGWIVITPNKYKTNVVKINRMEPSWENAMDSLVKLYNKRKDEYIAMWGEETYENMFLFPNYDYDYDYYDDEDYDDDNDYDDDEYEYDDY
jgi:hypothetical protein